MGGRDTNSNMVALSARQHFVCHLLLTRMTNNKKYLGKLKYAAILLKSVNGYTITNRLYEKLKSNITQDPEWVKKRTSKRVGLKHPPEAIEKIKEKAAKRHVIYVSCIECKQTTNIGNYKKLHGEKCGKVSLRAWNKGKPMPHRGRKLKKTECPYCGKLADVGNFARWHGEKCKFKDEYEAVYIRSKRRS